MVAGEPSARSTTEALVNPTWMDAAVTVPQEQEVVDDNLVALVAVGKSYNDRFVSGSLPPTEVKDTVANVINRYRASQNMPLLEKIKLVAVDNMEAWIDKTNTQYFPALKGHFTHRYADMPLQDLWRKHGIDLKGLLAGSVAQSPSHTPPLFRPIPDKLDHCLLVGLKQLVEFFISRQVFADRNPEIEFATMRNPMASGGRGWSFHGTKQWAPVGSTKEPTGITDLSDSFSTLQEGAVIFKYPLLGMQQDPDSVIYHKLRGTQGYCDCGKCDKCLSKACAGFHGTTFPNLEAKVTAIFKHLHPKPSA